MIHKKLINQHSHATKSFKCNNTENNLSINENVKSYVHSKPTKSYQFLANWSMGKSRKRWQPIMNPRQQNKMAWFQLGMHTRDNTLWACSVSHANILRSQFILLTVILLLGKHTHWVLMCCHHVYACILNMIIHVNIAARSVLVHCTALAVHKIAALLFSWWSQLLYTRLVLQDCIL